VVRWVQRRPMSAPPATARRRAVALRLLMLLTLASSGACQRGCAEPSRTGTFDSRALPDRVRRLEFVQRYLRPHTPVDDAAFLVDFLGAVGLEPALPSTSRPTGPRPGRPPTRPSSGVVLILDRT